MMRTIAHYVSDYSILERIVPFLVRKRERERERGRGREIEKRGRERGRDRERQREEKRKRRGKEEESGRESKLFNFCFHVLSPLLSLYLLFLQHLLIKDEWPSVRAEAIRALSFCLSIIRRVPRR